MSLAKKWETESAVNSGNGLVHQTSFVDALGELGGGEERTQRTWSTPAQVLGEVRDGTLAMSMVTVVLAASF
jgi:hypothetical protein